uniref:Immunoglobulin domain-containing protein n=1 Tax=Cyprinus carpio TaxID=7962 RepID=A0A8C2AZG4_CYPCA
MLLLLFVLLVDGVSGAETDISVIEGDPVTLNTGLTQILNDHTIQWKFGPEGSLISQITRDNDFTVPFVTDDERFRGRLQVDPITGSLTIRNTRIRLSGQYHLEISRGGTRPTYKIFNVTVQRVISGTDGVKSQSVSVMKGESVTLNPDKSLIHGDDLMLWVFVDKDINLATIDVETKEISLNDADVRFRGRLELDQTGSLTIKDTSTTDSGLYQLQIRGRESLQQFILTVNQSLHCCGFTEAVIRLVLSALVGVAAVAVLIYDIRSRSLQQKKSLQTSQSHSD